jgi:hypothetical protein
MPNSRQRAVDDSHSDVEIERRFRSIADRVLSSQPEKVGKGGAEQGASRSTPVALRHAAKVSVKPH